MRKKLVILLLLLATTCRLNPVFSGENGFNTTSDTTIYFIQGITDYNLVLEGRKQLFVYDIVQPLTNNTAKLRIKNNSAETIVISAVRSSSSGKMLADLSDPDLNEEIKPGTSFCIAIRSAGRPGPFSASASVKYKADGEEKEMLVRVQGFVAKKPEPVQLQSTVIHKPEGLTRFEIEELITREENKRDYSFILGTPPETRDLFVTRPKKYPVFSWDTLRADELSLPLLFHFKNTSKYIVTILKTEGKDASVYYRDTANQILVLPDSSFTLEVIPNLFANGDFYHSFVIFYQSDSGVRQFELKQWGYIQNNFRGISAADTLRKRALRDGYGLKKQDKTAPIRLYVFQEGKSVYPDARLELFSKESKAIIQSGKDEHGIPFFQIHRNGWDTLFIHVLSPEGEVLQKTRLTDPFEYDYYGLPFFQVTAPYTYYIGKSPYRLSNGIYKLAPEDNEYRDVDPDAIKKQIANTPIQFLINGTVEIKNPDKAIALEKKLLLLSKPIRLLPVIQETKGNGGIHWYSNSFTVIFYDHVSDEQIRKIFTKYKITNYSKQTGYKRNSWTFSQESVIDRKYITLLDQLWQLKEVSGLIQETAGIDGHD